MNDDGTPPHDVNNDQDGGSPMNDDNVAGGTFFQKALAQIKPAFMKLLVVLVFALLLAPQAVRGFQSPILALVIIVTPFLFFAIFVVALEFRDRQVSDLYRENENLKKAIRPLARENPNLKTQIQQLRRENANLKAEVQQFSNPINPSDKSSKLHDFEHLKAPIRQL